MNAAPSRVAIVTGASSGIGRSIAVALAADGWSVGFTYGGDKAGAQETARRIAHAGGESFFARSDAGLKSEVVQFHDAVKEWRGVPDLLVNNAGIQTWGPLIELDEEDWNRVIRTNLTGCFLNTQAAARAMRAAGKSGAIVNIGSGCNKLGFADLVAYTASKGGIEQLTKVAAIELGPLGITVNCVAPGAIMIDRTAEEGGDYAAIWSEITPMRRIGTPDDVAEAVMFFASGRASFVSGQTLYVDGGVFSQARWPAGGA